MFKEQPTKPEKEEEFNKFVQEMETRKKLNLSKKERGKHYDPHWEGINPSELIEEDRAIYQEFKNKIPTDKLLKDFEQYRDKIPWQSRSRVNFYAWLGNKINARMGLEMLKKEFKKPEKE